MFWSRISRIAIRPTWYSSALLIIALAGPPRSGRSLPIDALLGVKLALAADSAAAAQVAVTVNRQPSRAAQVRGISSRDINILYFTSTLSWAPRFPPRPRPWVPGVYGAWEAKPGSRERSPRTSVTCPEYGQPWKRFTT